MWQFVLCYKYRILLLLSLVCKLPMCSLCFLYLSYWRKRTKDKKTEYIFVTAFESFVQKHMILHWREVVAAMEEMWPESLQWISETGKKTGFILEFKKREMVPLNRWSGADLSSKNLLLENMNANTFSRAVISSTEELCLVIEVYKPPSISHGCLHPISRNLMNRKYSSYDTCN